VIASLRTGARLATRVPPWAVYAAWAALALALSLLLLGETDDGRYRSAGALAVALLLAQALPLVLAPRAPLAVLVVIGAADAAHLALGYLLSGGALALLVAFYTVGARCPPRHAAVGAVFMAVLLPAMYALDRMPVNAGNVVGNTAVFACAGAVGVYVRSRRERLAVLEERAARLERERELLAREAVADERARIARELHDVVAHAVTVMTVQSGAARRVMDADRDAARDALSAVEATGREALAELRRLLDVLRTGDEATDALAPQPTAAGIEDLVAETRRAGVPVELRASGSPRGLPPGMELTVFRIVQEALTNVRKHAGPARAGVRIAYAEDAVEVEVRDDGRGAAAEGGAPGHGVVGMRERVALFGGSLEVGPAPEGGWRVRARLPLRAAVAA